MKSSLVAILRWLAIPVVSGLALQAQTPSSAILTLEMENVVQYQEGFANPTKNGTSTTTEPRITAPVTFFPALFISDIVAVNGTKAKGAAVARNYWLGLSTNPSGSQAIADVNRFQMMDIVFEIQQADGSALGTIVLQGVTGGPPPLGAPKVGVTGEFAVIGGTGAFLGVRGQAVTIGQTQRPTSTLENPINRRSFQGGTWKIAIQLIPLTTPEIISTGGGPAIVHSSDYTPVNAAKPAKAGELLTLYATGLGPTRPGVEPGQAFPASPAQAVGAPVEVLVNGSAGDVLYAGGYPNATNTYQVNFRVPAESAPGTATVQLRAAWIPGGEAKIPIQ